MMAFAVRFMTCCEILFSRSALCTPAMALNAHWATCQSRRSAHFLSFKVKSTSATSLAPLPDKQLRR